MSTFGGGICIEQTHFFNPLGTRALRWTEPYSHHSHDAQSHELRPELHGYGARLGPCSSALGAFSHSLLAHSLLDVDDSLPFLSAEPHHLMPALAVRFMPHQLYLGLHARFPKTARGIHTRERGETFVAMKIADRVPKTLRGSKTLERMSIVCIPSSHVRRHEGCEQCVPNATHLWKDPLSIRREIRTYQGPAREESQGLRHA